MDGLAAEDFKRLEGKVDKLTDAVTRLILVEERQTTQGERIGKVEVTMAQHDVQITANRAEIDRWVQRGIGAWFVAAGVFAILKFGAAFL
jgi:uncharacterized protein with PhoU and TrkA domain